MMCGRRWLGNQTKTCLKAAVASLTFDPSLQCNSSYFQKSPLRYDLISVAPFKEPLVVVFLQLCNIKNVPPSSNSRH